MRLEVIAALRSLSDRHYQQTRWGKIEEGVNFYDDLTVNVHTLYDDCMVLPDPQDAVSDVLYEEEILAFVGLGDALGPMLQDLGDAPDETYTADPRWASVVKAAREALEIMQRADRRRAL